MVAIMAATTFKLPLDYCYQLQKSFRREGMLKAPLSDEMVLHAILRQARAAGGSRGVGTAMVYYLHVNLAPTHLKIPNYLVHAKCRGVRFQAGLSSWNISNAGTWV